MSSDWHAQSLPHIVDATGKRIFTPLQYVNHPGLYDETAYKDCDFIVSLANEQFEERNNYTVINGVRYNLVRAD